MIRQARRLALRRLLAALPERLAVRVCRGRPRTARLLPVGIRTEIGHYLGEYRVFVDTTFPIEREMASGLYDRRTVDLFKRQVKPGDVCIDIGANVGALTLALAQLCGPRGMVIAVEPGSPNFRKLQANLAGNPQLAERVRAFQMGLADEDKTLTWDEDPDNRGNAYLNTGTGSETVPVTTLDALLAQRQPVSRVDFIKIDVEGMELDVLRGAQGTLRKHRPKVYFESQRRWREQLGAAYFEAIERLFLDHDYQLYRMRRNGSLEPTRILETSQDTLALPK